MTWINYIIWNDGTNISVPISDFLNSKSQITLHRNKYRYADKSLARPD